MNYMTSYLSTQTYVPKILCSFNFFLEDKYCIYYDILHEVFVMIKVTIFVNSMNCVLRPQKNIVAPGRN